MSELKSQKSAPWHLAAICDEKDQYVYRKTGKGVSVYVLDTGIKLKHPEFEDLKFVETVYSFDDKDYDPDGISATHGTSVASCVAGKKVGVAKEADIFNLRFDLTRQTAVEAVKKAIEHKNENEYESAVIVKSFGGPNPMYRDELDWMEDEGLIVVAAAGNESVNISKRAVFPAKRDNTLAVGAVNERRRLSTFSNYGKNVDILAPGSNIICGVIGDPHSDSLVAMNGTSFSAPIVAGVIAQMCEGHSVRDQHDVEEVRDDLIRNAFDGEITLKGKQKKTPNKFVNSLVA